MTNRNAKRRYSGAKGPAFGLALLFCASLAAQQQSFPASQVCNGTDYTDANLPQAYTSLRFAPTLTCSIPLPPGLYAAHLVLVEPNRNAVGQRVMTVTVQGQPSPRIDIFASIGIDRVLMWPFEAQVNAGLLNITLTGIVGNAVLSAIVVGPNATPWTVDRIILDVRTLLINGEAGSSFWLTKAACPTSTADSISGITFDAVLCLDADGRLKLLRSDGTLLVLPGQ